MIDSFLFDAGSVFFVAWALTLTSLCVVAFEAVTCFHPKPCSIVLSGPVTRLRPTNGER